MSKLPINIVKVFSVTRARDRDHLGDEITKWLAAHPSVTVLRTAVRQSSDAAFHCLSFVLLGYDLDRA